MIDTSLNGVKPALSSDWGGLSPHLIATFFAVKKVVAENQEATRWERDSEQPEVRALVTDANFEMTLNWQSPFENVGPDQQFSSFSAMLQAGGFNDLLAQLKPNDPTGSADALSEKAAALEGKSNLTKLNSTQIFTGMPPARFPVTVHFRAFANADAEVTQPMNQLIEWSVPKKIAPNGPIVGLASGSLDVFASEVPQIIGMKLADRTFLPLVIETIPVPLSGPRTRGGALAYAAMQMQLATLTALDKADWRATATATGGGGGFGGSFPLFGGN